MLKVAIYYSKGIQNKISKGKERRAESSRDQARLPVILPQWSWPIILPATICENTHQVLPLKEAYPGSSPSRIFTEGHHVGTKFCMTNFISHLQCPQGSNGCNVAQGSRRIKTDIHHKSYCQYDLTQPKTQDIQRHFYQAGYSRGLEVISQELGKGQFFLWNAWV